MSEDDTLRTRRFSRVATPVVAPEQAIRVALAELRKAPRDPESRRVLHAIAAEHGNWDELARLVGDEARAARDPETAAALFEELADIYDNFDQPLETIAAMEEVLRRDPDDVDGVDRLARLYHAAGAWQLAAETFERVASRSGDSRGSAAAGSAVEGQRGGIDARARASLLAAGKLWREHGKPERAVDAYRALLDRRMHDADALRALDELYAQLGRWNEAAEVRGRIASRVAGGLEKAALLRGQARALEKAGRGADAAAIVAQAASYAPDDVSGIVDYAQVLAREGRGGEAADILRQRIVDSDGEARAGLRMRLATVLDDAGDRAAAAHAVKEALAEAPDYAPALERQAAFAIGEPRAHAEALVKYAAAIHDPMDRAALFVEAARQFKASGDDRAALRALEAACDHAPDDRDLVAELDEAKTTVAIADARLHADRANPDAALRRLRSTLELHPYHTAANTALVDLLTTLGRLDSASEHLASTLADAPPDLAADKLAPLVFRYAQVRAALQDPDEAHQLLHEAHRLDRKSLAYTLALGESCFARRLWREAAIHLGGLATHADAPQHAVEVAAGLVHAALACTRGMRPADAAKHNAAAAKLDPNNAKAWHALGEAAMARDDMPKAFEYLEREAAVTADAAERVRLYDALGDLALEHLEDPARAERCWSKVEDAGVLDKLLELQRARRATVERADTAAKLAALDPSRSRELGIEAIDTYTAAGQVERAADQARLLAQRHPADLDAILAASSVTGAVEPDAIRRAATVAVAKDPRAVLLWARLGDAERVRKNERQARAAYDRALAAATDGELSADAVLIARRGIVALGQAAGESLGAASLAAIVAADPRAAEVVAWARELRETQPVEARAAYELALGLAGRLAEDDWAFFEQHRPRPMASDEQYAAPLDDADRRALIDDADDAPLGEFMELLAEVAQTVSPDPQSALRDAGFADAQRLSAASDAETAALFPQIAKLLGGPPTLLFSTAKRGHFVSLLFASPPVVVVGPELAEHRARSRSDAMARGGDGELRFKLGRLVELSRPRRVFAQAADFAGFVDALATEKLRASLPIVLRKRLADALASLASERTLASSDAAGHRGRINKPDAAAYQAACQRAADRAGLLACGDASIAVALAPHLARLAASPRYLAVRQKLRRA